MLGRANRFHGHGGVRRVYRLGKPSRTSMFSLHFLQNEKVRSSKVAIVVSRKVHKSAVIRNRIRRRIYEQMRHRLSAIKTPTEMVITVYHPETAEIPAEELNAALDELLRKARL